jgi:hypothetical protein
VEAVAIEGVGGDDAFGGLAVAEDGVDGGFELADQRRLACGVRGWLFVFSGVEGGTLEDEIEVIAIVVSGLDTAVDVGADIHISGFLVAADFHGDAYSGAQAGAVMAAGFFVGDGDERVGHVGDSFVTVVFGKDYLDLDGDAGAGVVVDWLRWRIRLGEGVWRRHGESGEQLQVR